MGSFNYDCAKWLSDRLMELRSHETVVRDTPAFLDMLGKHPIENAIMVSFDAVSLFTNIPVDFTINLILNSIFNKDNKTFHGLNKSRLKKLLTWCAKTTTFQFNGKFYKQTDGVAMGSPIAPLMADVFMNHVVTQALKETPIQSRPDLLCRYVDDLFLLFPSSSAVELFYTKMNSVHRSVQFTKDFECNNSIPFLDVLVQRTPSGLCTSTYRKPTHTGLYSKWSSFVPLQYKRNLVTSLLNRAHFISSSYEIMHKEFETIKSMLMRNGFPPAFICSCIRKLLTKQRIPKEEINQSNISPTRKKYIVFRLPFIGAYSYNIQQELRNIRQHFKLDEVVFRLIHDTCKLKSRFPIKDPQPLLSRSNVVYKLKCSCGDAYIGQTKRNLLTRINEHRKSIQSEVNAHLERNPTHTVNFTEPEILASARGGKQLLLLESLLIQEHRPALNVDNTSTPLVLFNV